MKTHFIENSIYIINELGIIINTKTNKTIKTRVNQKGYVCCNLYVNSKYKHYKIHRLLGLCFIPNPENYPCMNHIDGNKLNNNLSNLEWCTLSHNTKHAYNIGLIKKKRKFSTEIEKEILHLYISQQFNQYELAEKYNTSQALIQLIIKRQACGAKQ